MSTYTGPFILKGKVHKGQVVKLFSDDPADSPIFARYEYQNKVGDTIWFIDTTTNKRFGLDPIDYACNRFFFIR